MFRKGAPSGDARDSAAAEPVFTVLTRLVSNIAALVQIRILLGGQEARAYMKEIARGAVFIGVAALVSVYVIGLLLASAVLALSLVMKPWAATLAVLGATVVAGLLLFVVGVWRLRVRIRRLRGVIEALKEDLRWLRTELFRSE
jgi:hypothetical protein